MNNPLQQTAQWFSDRAGCLTASRVRDILPGKTGKYLKSRADLLDDIVAERVTGRARDGFTTAAMQWGIDHEDEARSAYVARNFDPVELVGFVRHPDIPYFGASPDGLVGDDGLIEIKCPSTTTHLRYVRAGVVPEEYRPQILTQLICTGRKWCDFVSYDPRIQERWENLRFFCIRWEPAQDEKDALLAACRRFLAEVDAEMEKLLCKPE